METFNETMFMHTKTADNSFDYNKFGRYLEDIEAELSSQHILKETDKILDQIEAELDSYDAEIMSADEEIRRKIALTALDSYNLNLLARDENFNIKILALCNKNISPAILNQTVEDVGSNDKFTLMTIANNPSTPSETLNRIFDLAGDEREVQTAILNNPNCNDVLKFRVKNTMRRNIE